MDPYELRIHDYSLSEEQEVLTQTYKTFFLRESPTSAVRAAEPLGFDEGLWRRLVSTGVTTMALPESAGGDGATIVELALVAEELGRSLAPVPMISHSVATRLLARAGADPSGFTDGRLVTLALQPSLSGRRQLVPDAAIAGDVIALGPEGLALYPGDPVPHTPNLGCSPLGWWAPAGGAPVPLASGEMASALHLTAVDEWRLLTASALVGVTAVALDLAADFARTRETLGVPIGALQGVSFQLADIAIAVAGARNLVRRAAWMHEHEAGVRPDLPTVAYLYAARTAADAVSTSQHVQGGLGFTVEADISLYFRRAKGWGVLGIDAARALVSVGRFLLANAPVPLLTA
jgi:alkylation response protein AidB-like acyl-CoA dehydrogenase